MIEVNVKAKPKAIIPAPPPVQGVVSLVIGEKYLDVKGHTAQVTGKEGELFRARLCDEHGAYILTGYYTSTGAYCGNVLLGVVWPLGQVGGIRRLVSPVHIQEPLDVLWEYYRAGGHLMYKGKAGGAWPLGWTDYPQYPAAAPSLAIFASHHNFYLMKRA